MTPIVYINTVSRKSIAVHSLQLFFWPRLFSLGTLTYFCLPTLTHIWYKCYVINSNVLTLKCYVWCLLEIMIVIIPTYCQSNCLRYGSVMSLTTSGLCNCTQPLYMYVYNITCVCVRVCVCVICTCVLACVCVCVHNVRTCLWVDVIVSGCMSLVELIMLFQLHY